MIFSQIKTALFVSIATTLPHADKSETTSSVHFVIVRFGRNSKEVNFSFIHGSIRLNTLFLFVSFVFREHLLLY